MKYQNLTDKKLTLIGVGEVEAHGTIETDKTIENPNFKLVGEAKPAEKPVKKKDK